MRIFIVVTISSILLLFAIAAHGQTATPQTRPFSNYTMHKGLVFVSGQIGVDAKDQNIGFSEEVHQALKNVNAILQQAGSSLSQVMSVTVYLRSLDHFDEFNSVYKQYFHSPYPARTCVGVSDLVQNANVEISVIAGK